MFSFRRLGPHLPRDVSCAPQIHAHQKRRFIMKLHIASGILNCLLGPAVYLMICLGKIEYARLGCYIVGGEGLLIHLPTSWYLVPTAFGSVRIMIPGFFHAIVAYAYTLVHLATCRDEQMMEMLLSWWLLLHVYVFNRIVFGILTKFNMMASERYTVAILVGLAICMPCSMGHMSMLFLLGTILTFNLVYLIAKEPDHSTPETYSAGGTGNQALMLRDTVKPEGSFANDRTSCQQLDFRQQQRQRIQDYFSLGIEPTSARLAFNMLDKDESGYLDVYELADLLVRWGLPGSEAQALINEIDVNGNGRLEFDEFEQHLKPVWSFVANIQDERALLAPGFDIARKSILPSPSA